MRREKRFFFSRAFPGRGHSYLFSISNEEEEEPSTPTDQETCFSSLEAKLVALSCFEALAHKFDARSSNRPTVSQNSDLEEDFLPAENVDVFDLAESVISL